MADSRSQSLADNIYNELWHSIVFVHLEPGTPLDEPMLVERFKASRTPVREALVRLSAEGLVTFQRGKGAEVSQIRLSQISAFFESLHLIQRAIYRLCSTRWIDEDLERIREAVEAFEKTPHEGNERRICELAFEMHSRVGVAARNPYLETLYRRLLGEEMRIILLHSAGRGWRDDEILKQADRSVVEHRELLDAITMRDADLAERLASEHMKLIRFRVASFSAAELSLSV